MTQRVTLTNKDRPRRGYVVTWRDPSVKGLSRIWLEHEDDARDLRDAIKAGDDAWERLQRLHLNRYRVRGVPVPSRGRGGEAAARNMTPEQRSERARKAARARWGKTQPEGTRQ